MTLMAQIVAFPFDAMQR